MDTVHVSRSRISLTTLAVVAGMLISIALVGAAGYYLYDHERDLFTSQVSQVRDVVTARINTAEEGVEGFFTLFNSTTYVDSEQYRLFADNLLSRHSYIRSISYMPYVIDSRRDSFELFVRGEGWENFTISETLGGEVVPATRRPRYLPVLHHEPAAQSAQDRAGFDILSIEGYRPTITNAIETAQTCGSRLQSFPGQPLMLVLFRATYATITPPLNEEQRRDKVSALLALKIDAANLLEGVPATDDLKTTLEASGKDASQTSAGAEPEVDDPRWIITWLTATEEIRFAGQSLLLKVLKPVQWKDINTSFVMGGFLIGQILTVLLVMLARSIELRALDLRQRNEQIQALVTHRTRELAQERARAHVTLESIGDAVITTTANAEIEYMNPVAERLTGWKGGDAAGKPAAEIICVVNEASKESIESLVQTCLRLQKPVTRRGSTEIADRHGRIIPIDESASPLHDQDGNVTGVVLVFHDVSHVRKLTQHMTYQATHDALTGLPNRALLMDRLSQTLSRAPWSGKIVAVMFLDLDRFKLVNDTLGHDVGDDLLLQVAQRLKECLRDGDTVSRLGGDEFVIILQDIAQNSDVELVAGKIIATLNRPFELGSHELLTTASIGICSYPEGGREPHELLKNADTAMYRAKKGGKNNFVFYAAGMDEGEVS